MVPRASASRWASGRAATSRSSEPGSTSTRPMRPTCTSARDESSVTITWPTRNRPVPTSAVRPMRGTPSTRATAQPSGDPVRMRRPTISTTAAAAARAATAATPAGGGSAPRSRATNPAAARCCAAVAASPRAASRTRLHAPDRSSLQHPPQQAARPEQLRLRGPDGDPAHPGDLLVRVAFHVEQHEYFPGARGQRGDRAFEIQALPGRRRPATGSLEHRLAARRRDAALAPAAAAPLHQHHVDREAVQPRPECAVPAEGPQPLPGADERVLRPLLGGRGVSREPQTQGVDPAGVLVVELPEGCLVPVLRAANTIGQIGHEVLADQMPEREAGLTGAGLRRTLTPVISGSHP